jgi:hypothetical protein
VRPDFARTTLDACGVVIRFHDVWNNPLPDFGNGYRLSRISY